MSIIGVVGSTSDVLRSSIEGDIALYLDRSDLASYIPTWFNTAYREIQRKRNFVAAEFTTTIATITSADASATIEAYTLTILPALLKNITLVYTYDIAKNHLVKTYGITSLPQLRARRHETDEFNPFLSSIINPGIPSSEWDNNLCALWAGRLELWPPVGSEQVGQEIRLDGYQWLTPPASDQADWFTINARDWLLYRSLMESAPFLVADPRLAMWKSLADNALTGILGVEVEFDSSGQSLVMRG